MKVAVFVLAIAAAVLVDGHSLGPNNVQLIKNKETAQKLARILILSAFARAEAKSRALKELNNEILIPILPPVPDPTNLDDEHYILAEDSGYSQVVYGTISRCTTVMTGGSTIVDDLSFSIGIPAKVNWKLDIGAIHLEGGHDMDLAIIGGALNLTSSGGYTVDLEGFDLDLEFGVTVFPTGSFDVDSANLNLVFAKFHLFGEHTFGNGEPFDWEGFNGIFKELFDAQWPTYKPQVDEIIKFTVAEMTKTCSIYDMIGGDYSCITPPPGVHNMLKKEINGLLEMIPSATCPTPPPPVPTPVPVPQFLLYSDNVTNWGDWPQAISMCPEGTYAQGFQIKNEGFQGPADDTAMNGLRLYCGTSEAAPSITSLEGGWGGWGANYFCANGGFINGFQMRLESPDQPDDTAANNIRVYCSTNAVVPIEGDGGPYGDWRGTHKCGNQYGVCGLMTQVEPDQGFFGDDTALNNVAFLCCLR